MMTSLNEMMSDNSYIDMREMLKDCISNIQKRTAKTGVPGIPTGFKPLDNLIGGFEKGKVYVIGGRPSLITSNSVTVIVLPSMLALASNDKQC